MRKFLFIFFLGATAGVFLHAQHFNRYIHRQFEVEQQQKNSTTLHVHETPILFYSERTTHTRYAVEAIFPNGYDVMSNTFSITGKLVAFGQEQIYNSAMPSGMPAADSLVMQALLHKNILISVRDNQQQMIGQDSSGTILLLQPEDVSRFLLPVSAAEIQQGYSWSDSTSLGGSSRFSRYLVTKKTSDTLEVMVFSEIQLQTRFMQQQQPMLQQLKGYAKGYRWYDPATGILKRETLSTSYNGSSETGDQRFPVSISITAETRLKELN
ncbi:MAG TPA: hypothetical protein VJ552_04920 [Sediminibacterium sp.]|nr:hypothetical protein [Sediminibacterium sp.]